MNRTSNFVYQVLFEYFINHNSKKNMYEVIKLLSSIQSLGDIWLLNDISYALQNQLMWSMGQYLNQFTKKGRICWVNLTTFK